MDVFSNIKNVAQKTQNLDNITNQNSTKHVQVEKVNKLSNEQHDIIESQDKNKLKKELQKLTEELNKALNPLNTTLKFHFNDKIDELTVKVVDTKNDKVIREYPPKEALELMEKMREVVGLLFDKKG
ncbi:flagellar biosynthesis protein FlaG [Nautilia sp. PV-1]|uniref:flagellar protein FlaG n=1 Tax=Nautilia sp. PV-1 TaxID=2579250 RepID=UPI000FDCA214|nr:flagellar protein FlaG [Nautilia sp. PV-1]AZV46191.1 flagellar biosynthesis protein FlaG [Nautilia sp. PV-1]